MILGGTGTGRTGIGVIANLSSLFSLLAQIGKNFRNLHGRMKGRPSQKADAMTPFETPFVATAKPSPKDWHRDHAAPGPKNDPVGREKKDFSTVLGARDKVEARDAPRADVKNAEQAEAEERSEDDDVEEGFGVEAGPANQEMLAQSQPQAAALVRRIPENGVQNATRMTPQPSEVPSSIPPLSEGPSINAFDMQDVETVDGQETIKEKQNEPQPSVALGEMKRPQNSAVQNLMGARLNMTAAQGKSVSDITDGPIVDQELAKGPNLSNSVSKLGDATDSARAMPNLRSGHDAAPAMGAIPPAKSAGPDRPKSDKQTSQAPGVAVAGPKETPTLAFEQKVEGSIPVEKLAAPADIQRQFKLMTRNAQSEPDVGGARSLDADSAAPFFRTTQTSLATIANADSPVLARHVATQIAAAVQHRPDGVTEVTLNPQELGRVQMTLRAHEQSVTMVIIAERTETGEMLRRHVDQLAQEFRSMGFTSVNFEFGGQSPRQGQDRARQSSTPAMDAPPTDPGASVRATTASSRHNGSLDLRL